MRSLNYNISWCYTNIKKNIYNIYMYIIDIDIIVILIIYLIIIVMYCGDLTKIHDTFKHYTIIC